MHLTDVNKILKIFNSRDWSEYYDYVNIANLKKNIWFKINQTKEFDFVKDIIQSDIKKINSKYLVSDWVTFLIYEKGDFFAEHSDGTSYNSKENKTIFSAGYLLNTDYEGGDFIINGKKLNANIGELFYFGRDVLHEVREVKSGIRYSLHFAIDTEKDIL